MGREGRGTQADSVVPIYSVPIEKTSGCNHIKCWKVGVARPGQASWYYRHHIAPYFSVGTTSVGCV